MGDDNGIDISDHMGLVFTFARRRAAMYRMHVDDILGPCFEGLAIAADRYDPARGRFSTFAYRCMLTRLWSTLKKERQRLMQRMGERFDCASEVAEEIEARPDRAGLIRKAFEVLDDRERFILTRIFADGANGGIVSRELGISKQRVAQIRKKAMQRCRRALKHQNKRRFS